jgi:hypothetical protein
VEAGRAAADRPYHVALEDRFIREHCDEIYALCKFNSLPVNATGEVIESEPARKGGGFDRATRRERHTVYPTLLLAFVD